MRYGATVKFEANETDDDDVGDDDDDDGFVKHAHVLDNVVLKHWRI